MAETLARFDSAVSDGHGRLYVAEAWGREREDGLWEGWVEFEDSLTGKVLPSSRETTQPNLDDLRYWASGLSTVYLEGALNRILDAELSPR